MTQKEEARRQQILEAARHVFAEKGFKGASVKELAAAANVSPALLYWYFQDKADLFSALLEDQMAGALDAIFDHVSPDMPPADFLPTFARFYLGQIELPANIALFRMVLGNTPSLPTNVHQVQTQLVGKVLGALQHYFRREVATGRMRPCDTEMVARTFMGSIMAYLMLKHVLHDSDAEAVPIEKLADGISDVILHGILPATGSLAP